MSKLSSWGRRAEPDRRAGDWVCPDCKGADPLGTNFWNLIGPHIVGYDRDPPYRSATRYCDIALVLECRKCHQTYWFHFSSEKVEERAKDNDFCQLVPNWPKNQLL